MPRSKPKASLSDLTPEQRSALLDYISWSRHRQHRSWKMRLSLDWQRAGSDWDYYTGEDRYCLLHQIRNQHGPGWLAELTV